MGRISFLAVLTIGVMLGAVRPANATAFGEVGTCDLPLKSFSTISAAVAAAPAGASILVCPGVYHEQVTINKPLTLIGEIDVKANTDRPVIAVPPPSQGLGLNVTSIFGEVFAAQVLVTVGPVNIQRITVDGTGAAVGPGTCVAGIFYASGSSGVVDSVTTRKQISNFCSTGIWAENGSGANEEVSIGSSSVHDFDGMGIFVGSNTSPSNLAAIVRFNATNGGIEGIDSFGAASLVSNNVVTGASNVGIYIQSEGGQIVSNTVAKSNVGIYVGATAGVTSNVLWNNTTGIELGATGITLSDNKISKGRTGIEFNCITPHILSSNLLNDLSTGFADVPLGLNPTTNRFWNLDAIQTPCRN